MINTRRSCGRTPRSALFDLGYQEIEACEVPRRHLIVPVSGCRFRPHLKLSPRLLLQGALSLGSPGLRPRGTTCGLRARPPAGAAPASHGRRHRQPNRAARRYPPARNRDPLKTSDLSGSIGFHHARVRVVSTALEFVRIGAVSGAFGLQRRSGSLGSRRARVQSNPPCKRLPPSASRD